MRCALAIVAAIMLTVSVTLGGDTIEKSFSIGEGKLLEVVLHTGGSIDVLGWDGNEVKVTAYLDGRDWQDCKFRFDEKPSGIEIISDFDRPWGSRKCDVDLKVRVPRIFDIDLETAGGGIDVEDIRGKLKGKTNGGRLSLDRLSGEIDFKTNGGSIGCTAIEGRVEILTNGGSITCENSAIDGRIHTNGGNITMRNVSGDFDCTTNGGRVIYDNDKSFKPGDTNKVIKIRTLGGDIDVSEAPLGADVKTNGGNISIESAAKFVIAETNGGNIDIDEVEGWIEAHTDGGNITVNVVGSESGKDRAIELSSSGGEVRLTLPDDFSGEFDISLAYTKNARRDYKISSDFDISTNETDEWDYSHGLPRKYIDGAGEVNGGRNKIRIRTVNGDVKIIKG